MRTILLGAALLAPLVSGCAAMNSRGIAYGSGTESQLFVWKSNYSAGMGTNKGICAQGALTAFSTSAEGSAVVSDAVIQALQPTFQAGGEPAAEAAGSVASSAMLTNASNAQTAFANIALFYLCQISLNNRLSEATVAKMWHDIAETTPQIGLTGLAQSSNEAPETSDPQSNNGARSTENTNGAQ